MAEHDSIKVEVARMFGHEPNDIYGEPPKKETAKPQGFQEEVATVEELLGEVPPMDDMAEAPAEEMEAEKPSSDIDSLIERLQAVMDAEDALDEDKTSAEEMAARLQELQAAMTNAEEFLAEKEIVSEEEIADEAPDAGGEEVIA